ncbi:MAG: hypothetical protein BA861_01960 [Desulfobacterales bacterium S3730MH5]|nr:MAG: hypothetical protein BA861_01960 [Desulfobacterales bacterium S3730MH5]
MRRLIPKSLAQTWPIGSVLAYMKRSPRQAESHNPKYYMSLVISMNSVLEPVLIVMVLLMVLLRKKRRLYYTVKPSFLDVQIVPEIKIRVLDASRWFGKTGHLAGAFTRTGWKQLIDVLQFVTRDLGEDPYHWRDPVLLVILLQEVDTLMVFVIQLFYSLYCLYISDPLRRPVLKVVNETIFVHSKGFTFILDSWHTNALLSVLILY